MYNNFVSLATKYRPRKLSDLVGHEILVSALRNAFLNNRVHQAILFSGTRGVGKTTIARIIAMSLNCTENKDLNSGDFTQNIDPCLNCDSCLDILKNTSVDVIEIDAASNTGVDFIKDLISDINFNPFNSYYKIFIIDEVHMLSKSAFNALLKTLEEPPLKVKFIFATTELKKIPITVLSRCQKFYLKNIEKEIISNQIEKILKIEFIEFEKDALNLVSKYAKGSMRDALSILDKLIISSNNKIIDLKITKEILSDINILNLFYNLYLGNFEVSLKEMNLILESNIEIELILQELIDIITKGILYLNEIENLKEDQDIKDLFEKIKDLDILNVPKLTRIYQITIQSFAEIKNLNSLNFSIMFITKLCYASSLPTPIEALKMIKDKNIIDFITKTESRIIE